METLLDQIKKVETKNVKTDKDEFIGVALAWVKDEITITQIAKALNISPSSIYLKLAIALKQHLKT